MALEDLKERTHNFDPGSRTQTWWGRKFRMQDSSGEEQLWRLADYADELDKLKCDVEKLVESTRTIRRIAETGEKIDDYPEISLENLELFQKKMRDYVEAEEKSLNYLRLLVYEHTCYPKVREILGDEVDLFVQKHLNTDPAKDLRPTYHNLLYLWSLGAKSAGEGLYGFQSWMDENFPTPAQQEAMALLTEFELIKIDEEQPDECDVTAAGTLMLKRFDAIMGPSVAERCHQAFLSKQGSCTPQI